MSDPVMPQGGLDRRGALRAAVRTIQDETGIPVVFGAFVDDDSSAVLSEFRGVRTRNLHGLKVTTGSGLGGRSLAESRPVAVDDYRTSDTITHDYDRWVLGEGLTSVAAAPIMVRERPAALLYIASRVRANFGDRGKASILSGARRLGIELAVQDEVARRIRDAEAAATASPGHVRDVADIEEVRQLHAELRAIAPLVDDVGIAERISAISRNLADVGCGATAKPGNHAVLSSREVDVLSQIALGCTNLEAATRLSIKPETAKAYLRSAMRKLGVHNRYEAVVRSRSLGLLP